MSWWTRLRRGEEREEGKKQRETRMKMLRIRKEEEEVRRNGREHERSINGAYTWAWHFLFIFIFPNFHLKQGGCSSKIRCSYSYCLFLCGGILNTALIEHSFCSCSFCCFIFRVNR
ncbi:hypothetical protein BGX38DRAFT_296270 [Terfezia claveryi]|nr:hypothetical protein BGX38DRAFT_296270 [Terfezia claveryi]